jgi:xylose isomerase
MFIAHIGAMDTFARGLKSAAALINDGTHDSWLKERYSTFDAGFGATVTKGKASFNDCLAYVQKHGEPTPKSGQQEKYEALYNEFQ